IATLVVCGGVLFIGYRIQIAAPAPFLRLEDLSGWVDGLDRTRIGDHLLPDLVHAGAGGMHVAMGLMPDAVLVVEEVVVHAAARCRSELADEVLHPALLQRSAAGD